MDDLFIVLTIAAGVAIAWLVLKLLLRNDDPPTKPLDMNLKPEEPSESTRELQLEQLQRGPGKED